MGVLTKRTLSFFRWAICPFILFAQDLPVDDQYFRQHNDLRQREKRSKSMLFSWNRTQEADSIDVLHYELAVNIDPASQQISGTVTILIRSIVDNLTAFDLNLVALTVDSVQSDGSFLNFTQAAGLLHIVLPATYSLNDSFQVTIDYHGHPVAEPEPGGWGGFYFDEGNAYTLGVGLNSPHVSLTRNWIPCHDEPWDKATFDLTFTGPMDKTIASNGTLISATVDSANATATFHWIENHPTSTYLICLAMYDYVILEDSYQDTLPLVYYVWPQDSADGIIHFEHTPAMVGIFSDLFGPYVFDKVGYAATPKGAMEHQTCISYPGSVIGPTHGRDWLIAHELAHHWWGNWVTVGDWRDIWLSEGFATYAEALFMEGFYDEEAYRLYMQNVMNSYFGAEGQEGTFPIYDPVVMWGVHSYEKGGCVLHMLRNVVGDSLFFESLRQYGQTYGFSNATTVDFQAAVEEVTNLDLDWFFQEWIYGPGYPVYQYAWTATAVDNATYSLRGYIQQVRDDSILFNMPLEILITQASGDTTVALWMDDPAEGFELTLTAEPLSVELDPRNKILEKHTSIEYDPFEVVDYWVFDSIYGDGDENAEPGETAELVVAVKSIGSAVTNVSARLTTADEALTITDSTAGFGSFDYGETKDNRNFSFAFYVDSTATLHPAQLYIQYYIEGLPAAADTFTIYIYSPQVAFIDGFEYGVAKWDLGESWEPYFWAYEGDFAITDSPTSYYENNRQNRLTCRRRFDLSRYQQASLAFYQIHQFSTGDSGLVQIRRSQEAWQTVAAYTGMSPYNWFRSAVNLSEFCGPGNEDLQFSFVLKSDSAAVSDGWYLDNIILTVDSVITVATVDMNGNRPKTFQLYSNFPNPFNPATTIFYDIPVGTAVDLEIFDILGRSVIRLAEGFHEPGRYQVVWDGRDRHGNMVASGIYFYRLTGSQILRTKKMILLR